MPDSLEGKFQETFYTLLRGSHQDQSPVSLQENLAAEYFSQVSAFWRKWRVEETQAKHPLSSKLHQGREK